MEVVDGERAQPCGCCERGHRLAESDPGEPGNMKRATYTDVLNAPKNKVAKILDGELFLSPRPSPRHSVTSSRLGRALGPFDEGPGGPGGWWILDEPELHFGDCVVVPDLAGWRRERLPTMPEEAFEALELELGLLWLDAPAPSSPDVA